MLMVYKLDIYEVILASTFNLNYRDCKLTLYKLLYPEVCTGVRYKLNLFSIILYKALILSDFVVAVFLTAAKQETKMLKTFQILFCKRRL